MGSGGGEHHGILKLHGSFDRTVEHGRWASVSSARIYINEAAAEESALGSCSTGNRRIQDAIKACPSLLRRNFAVERLGFGSKVTNLGLYYKS